jgi:hypothetical protein
MEHRRDTEAAHLVYRVVKIGIMQVWERGSWHKREGLPKHVVSNEKTEKFLEEFRRLRDAKRFARQNKNG